MKKLQIFILLFLLVQFTHSQKKISESDLVAIKAKIENEISDLRKRFDTKDYFNANEKQLTIDFNVDTYRIDTLMARKINVDFSNQGMVQAMSDATVSYDKLLNKYYRMLFAKLSVADQEILKMTQRNWILYRDSEIKLINTLLKIEYAGVGLDQRLFAATDILDITKNRVVDLYDYLLDIKK